MRQQETKDAGSPCSHENRSHPRFECARVAHVQSLAQLAQQGSLSQPCKSLPRPLALAFSSSLSHSEKRSHCCVTVTKQVLLIKTTKNQTLLFSSLVVEYQGWGHIIYTISYGIHHCWKPGKILVSCNFFHAAGNHMKCKLRLFSYATCIQVSPCGSAGGGRGGLVGGTFNESEDTEEWIR